MCSAFCMRRDCSAFHLDTDNMQCQLGEINTNTVQADGGIPIYYRGERPAGMQGLEILLLIQLFFCNFEFAAKRILQMSDSMATEFNVQTGETGDSM